jgi:hypothetical protein
MHVVPEVARILASEPLLRLLKEYTRPGGTILTGECDLMVNTTSGWHKDITKEMGFDQRISDDESFRVYKVALYLQDQDETSRSRQIPDKNHFLLRLSKMVHAGAVGNQLVSLRYDDPDGCLHDLRTCGNMDLCVRKRRQASWRAADQPQPRNRKEIVRQQHHDDPVGLNSPDRRKRWQQNGTYEASLRLRLRTRCRL